MDVAEDLIPQISGIGDALHDAVCHADRHARVDERAERLAHHCGQALRGELLVVELGEFLVARPDDRLARLVDAIGEAQALAVVDAR